MKKVPFYGNHEDNQHGTIAVLRMLFDHFLDRHIGWDNLDKMAGFIAGQSLDMTQVWERMARQGFDVQSVELPTEVQVVDDLLADGRLVFILLGNKRLLVIDSQEEAYIVHDPGLPPAPYTRIPKATLAKQLAEGHITHITGVKYQPRHTRADIILARMYPTYSRAALAKLFKAGKVTYNSKVLKPGDKLLSNLTVEADLSSLRPPEPTDIELPVIFEDEDVLVINKPAGVLTHAVGEFASEASVATFIRQRTADMTGERAGIVHRLDRATSGVLICAKNPKTLSHLQKQFARREVKKTYIAIVKGHLKQPEAIIDMPIERNPKAPATFRVGANGKSAVTHYRVLQENEKYSLVELKPETGRTHQLRVHLAHLGHAIVGDPLYGGGKFGGRMFLHAHQLELDLPVSREHKIFTAPLPPEFEEYMGL